MAKSERAVITAGLHLVNHPHLFDRKKKNLAEEISKSKTNIFNLGLSDDDSF
jgi:hypothetical protein